MVVNKCENEKIAQSAVGEAYGLGFGAPVAISAAHGAGFDDLYEAFALHFPEENSPPEQHGTDDHPDLARLDDIEGMADYAFPQDDDDPATPIKIAIVGRPNVGKSTLLNTIVEDQRVMTGPEAGITRDAIAVDWTYEGRAFTLVDTAGLRKKSRVDDAIEKMSVDDSLRAIRLAQIVILVLDGNEALEKQDLHIARHVIGEGRALVLAVNKWDCVQDRADVLETIKHKLSTSLAQVKDIQFATISAQNGRNIDKLFYKALQTYKIWNRRVATGGLNRWLAAMERKNPAPLVSGTTQPPEIYHAG